MMPEQELYQYLSIWAKTGMETEAESETRVMSAVRPLKDIFDIYRVSHMLAGDRLDEVTFGVLVEREADIDRVINSIETAAGISPAFMMVGPGLVHP